MVSVAVGDRTVVHDQQSGRIFALDAAATHIWEHLGGWRLDPSIDVSGPGVAPFVAQLRALGVLAHGAGDGDRELAGDDEMTDVTSLVPELRTDYVRRDRRRRVRRVVARGG